jgi:predicted PurR-regulated permease PerM
MIREHESRRIADLLFYGTVLLLAWLAYRIVEPFLSPIGWSVVLAICLAPVQTRLRPRLGATKTAGLLVVLVVGLLVLPLAFAGTALLTQGQHVVANLQAQLEDKGGAAAWLHQAWDWARTKLPMLPTQDEAIARVTGSVGDVAGFMASRAGGLLAGAAGFAFNLVIMLGVLFFLLRDSDAFAAGLKRILPFGSEQNERLGTLTKDLVSASVTATLTISLVQGLVGGFTFALLGIGGAALWGFIMGLLSFLPVMGATLVWLPAAVWLILSGSPVKGGILLGVGFLIMGHVDNVVRPLLLSGKSRMSTLVLIISLLGGVSAFGFIGIVLGPLVAAVLTALFESYDLANAPPEAVPAALPMAESVPGPVPEPVVPVAAPPPSVEPKGP